MVTADGTVYYDEMAYDYEYTHMHELIHVDKVDATATEDGNIEYWYCATCGKYFSDADAANEITQQATVIPATGTDDQKGDSAQQSTDENKDGATETGDPFSLALILGLLGASGAGAGAMLKRRNK